MVWEKRIVAVHFMTLPACLKGKGLHLAMFGAVASLIPGFVVLGILSIIFVYNAKPEFLQ
ncbi:MAG: hypothetical protein KAJ35_08810 [Thermoplasmata archaeon]|nr:hypothetical protein [Thermoplasmata archaeon]